MIVYDGTKADFIRSVEDDTIADEVQEKIFQKMGRRTPKSEFRSWENSMQHMNTVLMDAQIPADAGIAIEYNIPQTSKRVDFLISGYNAKKEPHVVIVELKQWEEVKAIDGPDALVETYTGGGLRTVVHPSYQVWSYASLIRDYNQSVQEKVIDLNPCCFLHNYRMKSEKEPLLATHYQTYVEDAPVFVKGDVRNLREFIKQNIVTGDNKALLYDIDSGKIRPSKSLQDAIGSMLAGNKEFVMIDEQKVAYEQILQIADKCKVDEQKRTVIVRGGPGTGKSVIAVNLLAELTKRNQFVQYVSKNSAPRNVYQQKLKGQLKKSRIDVMFRGSGVYTETDCNTVDTILVDEAHRLNAKSGMFQNMGENQIKEIIHSSLCSVFFIDESQRVALQDIGSEKEIEDWAKIEGSELHYLELNSQFRCNGSDGYLAWLDDVLDIRQTSNYALGDIDYDIRVFDSPSEMRKEIEKKNEINHRSRILAGYCWNWNKSEQNNTNYHDIVIGDFAMSWNLGSSIFALDDTSINEVGCIHTSQGLEFDYVGVIIGDDLRFEDEQIVTDFQKRAKTDQSMKGIKKMFKENPEYAYERADEIIKNTYRTLMTRGMKGCYITCVDEALREYFRLRLKVKE